MFWWQRVYPSLLLILACDIQVHTCVCYLGQELTPDRNSGQHYRWSDPQGSRCECTELRLGGLNIGLHLKPRQVTLGEGNRLTIGKLRPGDSVALGYNDVPTTPAITSGVGPCHNYTSEEDVPLEIIWSLLSPLRLEFTVQAPDLTIAQVELHGTVNDEEWHYSLNMEIRNTQSYFERPVDRSQASASIQSDFIGQRVVITNNNGRLEAGLVGVDESLLVIDDPGYLHLNSLVIELETDQQAKWQFYEPCK